MEGVRSSGARSSSSSNRWKALNKTVRLAFGSLQQREKQHQRDNISAKPTASRAGLWPLSWFAQIRHRARAATAQRVVFRPALALYRLAAVVLVAVILYWGAGTISANTVPGYFLYPLKLLTERVKFFLTINAEDKTELCIVFSSKRLREAVQQYQRSGTLDPSLLQQNAGRSSASSGEQPHAAQGQPRTACRADGTSLAVPGTDAAAVSTAIAGGGAGSRWPLR